MRSCAESALEPSSVTVFPLTATRPWRINSSALRREVMPAAAMIFCSLSCIEDGARDSGFGFRRPAPARLGLRIAPRLDGRCLGRRLPALFSLLGSRRFARLARHGIKRLCYRRYAFTAAGFTVAFRSSRRVHFQAALIGHFDRRCPDFMRTFLVAARLGSGSWFSLRFRRHRLIGRKLTSPEGLPRRPWYVHQIYAPGFYTGYGVKTIPLVREAIEQKQWGEADRGMGLVGNILVSEAALIESAAGELDQLVH